MSAARAGCFLPALAAHSSGGQPGVIELKFSFCHTCQGSGLLLVKSCNVISEGPGLQAVCKAVRTLFTSIKEKGIPRAKAPCIPLTKVNKKKVNGDQEGREGLHSCTCLRRQLQQDMPVTKPVQPNNNIS
eukprot:1139778-Pelagomonas_calceolata.AAC.2